MLPVLRNVDAFPIEHDGQQVICLRDPEGITAAQLLLTPMAFFIACHLDGYHDVSDILYACAQRGWNPPPATSDIHQMVAYLDEQGFLHTDTFAAMRKGVLEAYHATDVRPAYLAGQSYPDQAAPLRAFLDAFFIRDDGPGMLPGTASETGRPVRCLVAPHIDFHRGGHAYAHGYLRFSQQPRPHTIFIFGIAHAAPPVPFLLTQKHFATPFGTLETDQDIVRRLEAVCTWDPYAYENVQRSEHSIEFQAVMLAYLYGPQVRIVPILCASFGTVAESKNPAKIRDVTNFLDTCRDIVASSRDGFSVIAGADLAHVGKRFGDTFDIDAGVVQTVAERDREDLRHVTAADAEGFYQSVMQDHNHRRVCGLNCIYAALKTVDGAVADGEVLHYDYAHDPAGGIVSFTNVLFA